MSKKSETNHPWIKSYPAGLAWDTHIATRPLHHLLQEADSHFGARPAFDFMGKKQTWHDLAAQSEKFTRSLQDMGVKRGVKVGLFLPNSPLFLTAFYAIARTGATVVNYNPLYAQSELYHQIEDSETDIIITADLTLLMEKALPLLDETRLQKLIVASFGKMLPTHLKYLFKVFKGKELQKIPTNDPRIIKYEPLLNHSNAPNPVAINPDEDIALLQYTGGTTGVPKGAMLTHSNLTANVEQISHWFSDAKPGQERMLGVLPFFHIFALSAVINISVKMGMEIIALPRFDLDKTLKLIHTKKPTFFPAVPAIYNAINNHKDISAVDLTSVRYCISGGAPLPVEVKKTFEKHSGCSLIEGYGLTETSPVACANPISGKNKAGSIGLPFPNTILELIDAEDGKTPVEQGERGELCIRGPQVMKGYWKKLDDTTTTIKNGRLHTGDIAIMDEDGYFFIVDRLKDMIITNGYNVYPRNVEDAIYMHNSVEECIVAGLPHKDRGEVVKAWVKIKDHHSLTEASLRAYLADKLSPMEMPRTIEFRTEPLPKTMIGKLSRKDILAEEEINNKQSPETD